MDSSDDELPDIGDDDCGVIISEVSHRNNGVNFKVKKSELSRTNNEDNFKVKKRNDFYSDSSDVEEIEPPSLSERLGFITTDKNDLSIKCAENSHSTAVTKSGYAKSDLNELSTKEKPLVIEEGSNISYSDVISTNIIQHNSGPLTYNTRIIEKINMESNSIDTPREWFSYLNRAQTVGLSEHSHKGIDQPDILGESSQDTLESFADTGSMETEENSEDIESDGPAGKKGKLTKTNSRSELKAAKDRLKEEKRLEREQLKSEREKVRQEAEHEKMKKRMLQEAQRTMKPGECLKNMTVVLDTSLLTQSCGTAVATFLQGMNIKYEVCEQAIPNSITFWRASTVVVESASKSLENVQKDAVENDVVIYIPLAQFLDMVSACQRDRGGCVGGRSISDQASLTLDEYIRSIKSSLPSNHRLTLIVSGIDKHFRSQSGTDKGKAKVSNKRNEAGRSAAAHVTRQLVDECMLTVQLEHQVAVEFTDSDTDIAKLIFCYVKAIAEAPYKRSRQQTGFDLFMEGGSRSVKVGKQGEGLLQVWREQLMQFKNVNVEMSNAIVAKYPSPRLLMKAYEACSSEKEAELLLQDIEVRRGAGVLSTVRRIGKELSRRVYELMTATDPNYVIK